MCLTADQGVTSLIPTKSHTFVKIDHEIIFMVILLPSADSRRVVVSYTQTLLYRSISFILTFADHMNFRVQRQLAILYIQHVGR